MKPAFADVCPWERTGVQPVEVVCSPDGTPAGSADPLKGLLATSGERVAVLVQRRNLKTFVPIEPAETAHRPEHGSAACAAFLSPEIGSCAHPVHRAGERGLHRVGE